MKSAFGAVLGTAPRVPLSRLERALVDFGRVASASSDGLSAAWLEGAVDGFAGSADDCWAVGSAAPDAVACLASALERPAHLAQDAGVLFAAAYARWGASMLDRLTGRFAVVAGGGPQASALGAVDRLGAGALFVRAEGTTVTLASELRILLRLLPAQPAPDDEAVAHWLATGGTPYGRTLFAGVRRLTDGEAIVLEGGRPVRRRYWAPRYAGTLDGGPDELAARLGESIERAVARRLPAGGRAAIFVSGGIDSGTIAAAARRTAPARGTHVSAFSAVFPHHPSVDESALVHTLAESLGLPLQTIEVGTASMLGPALDYLRTWRSPSLPPNLHFLRRLVAQVEADRADVVIDGQGGDELFGAAGFYLADLLRRLRPLQAIALARRLPGIGATPSAHDLWSALSTYGLRGAIPDPVRRAGRRLRGSSPAGPSWLRPSALDALARVDDRWAWRRRHDGPLWWRALVDDLVVQRQRLGVHDFLRRQVGSGDTIDAHPFLEDAELVELVLRLPPQAAFAPVLDRPLLRATTAGELPDAIRLRSGKSFFDALFRDCLQGPDWNAVQTLLGPGDARVNAYVRPEAVRAAVLEAPPERRGPRWTWTTWRMLGIETWLRTLEDEQFPARAASELVPGA